MTKKSSIRVVHRIRCVLPEDGSRANFRNVMFSSVVGILHYEGSPPPKRRIWQWDMHHSQNPKMLNFNRASLKFHYEKMPIPKSISLPSEDPQRNSVWKTLLCTCIPYIRFSNLEHILDYVENFVRFLTLSRQVPWYAGCCVIKKRSIVARCRRTWVKGHESYTVSCKRVVLL